VKTVCRDETETMQLARSLAARLRPGDVVGLSGPLGAGKTTFVKGLAEGLGITEDVTSPTFTLLCEYQAPVPLYHFDCYRIGGEEEMILLGAEDYMEGAGITVIEWFEKITHLMPEKFIKISISLNEVGLRNIEVEGLSP
jgi:tRNA threonylcarbamoyladenosine biosynthesis protein TsaE